MRARRSPPVTEPQHLAPPVRHVCSRCSFPLAVARRGRSSSLLARRRTHATSALLFPPPQSRSSHVEPRAESPDVPCTLSVLSAALPLPRSAARAEQQPWPPAKHTLCRTTTAGSLSSPALSARQVVARLLPRHAMAAPTAMSLTHASSCESHGLLLAAAASEHPSPARPCFAVVRPSTMYAGAVEPPSPAVATAATPPPADAPQPVRSAPGKQGEEGCKSKKKRYTGSLLQKYMTH